MFEAFRTSRNPSGSTYYPLMAASAASSPEFSSISGRRVTKHKTQGPISLESLELGNRGRFSIVGHVAELHRAIYRAGMRRKVVRDRERGEAASLREAREKRRSSVTRTRRSYIPISSSLLSSMTTMPSSVHPVASFSSLSRSSLRPSRSMYVLVRDQASAVCNTAGEAPRAYKTRLCARSGQLFV